VKVLQVVHNFPPEFLGGVEQAVLASSRALRTAGVEVEIVAGSETHGPEPVLRREEHEGLLVHRLVRGSTHRNPVDPCEPGLAPLFDRLLLERKPDVVHVHHWWNLGDDLVRRVRRRGVACVLTLHDHFASCARFFRMPPGGDPCLRPQSREACQPCLSGLFGVHPDELGRRIPLRREAFQAEARAASVVLAPSASHARLAAEFLELDREIGVVPFSGAASQGSPASRPVPGRLRLLHFGNLCRVKGVEILARAVERADPGGDRIELVLAGAKSAEEELEFGRARWTGPYGAQDLARLAAASDLAVFPSLALESYGLVVDEALAHGLPVIVSDRGALSERIGARGVVVPAGSTEALADLLRAMLDEPALLDRLRAAPGPDRPGPREHARRLLAVYQEALSSGDEPVVDLEAPLLRRLEQFQSRLFLLLGSAPPEAASEMTRIPMIPRPPDVDRTGELVSVIIRTKDRPELLSEALASVAAQTHPAVEAVVVNDGGVDVARIVEAAAGRVPVRLLQPGAVGRCRAGNLGLAAARGTFIAWLDDDDLHAPRHLEVAMAALRAGPERVVYTDAWRIDQDREGPGQPWREVKRSVPHSEDFSRMTLLQRAYIHLVTVVHHRECVERLGGFDEALPVLEDWDLFYRFAQDYDFRHVPEVTASFRIRSDGSNAVTSLRAEFAATRSRLLARYNHIAISEIVAELERGRGALQDLQRRLARLEGRGDAEER
jgi:glycosyltransferase involved in cell wall biosynthesis